MTGVCAVVGLVVGTGVVEVVGLVVGIGVVEAVGLVVGVILMGLVSWNWWLELVSVK